MLRTFHRRAAFTVAAAGAAVALAAGSALAAGGWTVVAAPPTGQNATAVGSLAHWNGTAWSPVTLRLPANANSNTTLNAISADGPGDVWIVGSFLDSATEHFNGTAWSIVPSPSPGSIAMLGGVTTSNAANNVWAVGAETPAGTSVRQTLTLNWNGTAWKVVASPNPGSTDGVGRWPLTPARQSSGR
jgi:hypothetical protein